MSKSTETFDCCLYFTAGQFFREIAALAEESFMELGLSPSYAFVLMVIYEEEAIPISQVAQRVGLKPSTLTRLADKLERKGYITRRQEGRTVLLTKAALLDQEISKINNGWNKLFHAYNKVLGKENAEMLNQLLVESNKKFD